MTKKKILGFFIFQIFILLSSCTGLPRESITLNREVALGITSIHKSNLRFLNQYFELKNLEIDKYEKEAIETFFNKISAATKKPGVLSKDKNG